MNSKLIQFVFVLVVLFSTSQSAQALTPLNRELIEKEFAAAGSIVYDLYAPLGAPQIGVALIEKGQPDWELLVLSVNDRGKIEIVLSEAYSKATSNTHPFTLLYYGRHLLTFEAEEKIDERGATRLHGDLVVRDIADKGDLKELFKLRQVVDIHFTSDGIKSEANLLWQPATHFLNQPGKLPNKYNYFRLAYKSMLGEYKLYQHLEPIPGATTEDYANYNNRAIVYYYRGRLKEASRFLEKAWGLSGFDPVVVQHNQDFLKGELNNLESQDEMGELYPFSEALLYYWQGEFDLCLQVLAAKEAQVGMRGLADLDLVLTGLVMGQRRRWVEADEISVELSQRDWEHFDDYLYEMSKIAGYQSLADVEGNYLQALEVSNPDHPGYVAGISRLLRRQGEFTEAQRVLETYLRRSHDKSVDLLDPMQELHSLYLAKNDNAGIEWLTVKSLEAPLSNLLGYANMVDHWDLSNSLVDVEPEKTQGIKLSDKLLDQLKIME